MEPTSLSLAQACGVHGPNSTSLLQSQPTPRQADRHHTTTDSFSLFQPHLLSAATKDNSRDNRSRRMPKLQRITHS